MTADSLAFESRSRPDLCVFLDVDDLVEIGELDKYIEKTSTVLCYCSKGCA